MNTLVSIIVPCYKQAHFLNESLQSVLEQSYPYWECIVVDDGSPDDTKTVAQHWITKDDRFKYVAKNNGGLSSARNAGIKTSKGELILPLDADDVLHPDYLSKCVPELQNHPETAIVSCYTKFFSNSTNQVIHELKPSGTTFHSLCFENNLIATSLYRKSDWEAVGGYDETMKHGFEDWEFWVAITKSGKTYKVVPEFLFFYRKAKQSMLIDTLQYHRISNLEYVLHKHEAAYKAYHKNTITYLFFLINLYRNSELKTKKSIEYKIGRALLSPLRFIKSLFK